MQIEGGLVYYPDSEPGIRRKKHGRGFRYFAPDGTSIDDAAQRDRFKALAVPPAYENVWICPKPEGHLQATGRDQRARKQYRYHPDWRAQKEAEKYDALAEFGRVLPKIRRRIANDLKNDVGELEFAIAAVLALIDRAAMRVGHPEYTKENSSYGATTLVNRHLQLKDEGITLEYTGKGGKKLKRKLRDRTLHRVLEQLHDLPGKSLINWIDDDGVPQNVTSDRINATLADISGSNNITAKTFRTWAGSEAALDKVFSDDAPTIASISEAAAARLGNTPTIARKSYIHPAIIDLKDAERGAIDDLGKDLPELAGLRKTERALLKLLEAS